MKGILQIVLFAIVWGLVLVFTFFFALPLLAIHLALLFAGKDSRSEKALARFDGTLMREEQPITKAVQRRVFALWKRRAVVGITDSRMIVVQRGLLGGFTMSDIQWKDLADAKIEQNVLENLCGSNIEFEHLKAGQPLLSINGVPERPAIEIYSHAQSEEQAWEEKRRVRAMEEVRAASGGITLNGFPSAGTSVPSSSDNMIADLEKAKGLLDGGAISDAEYNEMKSKILARS